MSDRSWARTYRNNYQRAKKLARRRLPIEKQNDIEDTIQDAYIRLLEHRPEADGLENPASYALKAVQNVCFDRCHETRLKAENTVFLDAPKTDEDEKPIIELRDRGRGPAMDAEIKIDNEKLLRALESHCAGFTKRETCLLALYLQGLSMEQIASAWREDIKVVRHDMNAMLAKLRYRVQHGKQNEGSR